MNQHNPRIQMHVRYFKKLMNHKRLVLRAGRLIDVPLQRLIMHDWSKFRADEWRLNVEVWGVDRKDQKKGAYEALRTIGFPLHKSRNDHHPEWWGTERMSYDALIESVADCWATSQEHGGNLWGWWFKEGKYKYHQADAMVFRRMVMKLYKFQDSGVLWGIK